MFKPKFSSSNSQFGSKFSSYEELKGEDGFSPIVVVEETDIGYDIIITDKEKTSRVSVKDGKDGADGKDGVDGKDGKEGADGKDGYTPVRGTDYWTPTDIEEIKSYVDDAILGGKW